MFDNIASFFYVCGYISPSQNKTSNSYCKNMCKVWTPASVMLSDRGPFPHITVMSKGGKPQHRETQTI